MLTGISFVWLGIVPSKSVYVEIDYYLCYMWMMRWFLKPMALVVMIGYFVWVFPCLFGSIFSWIEPYGQWAIKLPVIGAVYVMFFILLWIGYTMATTPPLAHLDTPLDLEDDVVDDA